MSFDACADAVRKSDPDRFWSALMAPMPARAHLMALYAFNLEVARAPWVTAEPMIAEMRLQWWRDALDEIYAGGAVRRHEVVEPLSEAIRAADLPRKPFDHLIDARKTDIERPRMTPGQAFAYCDASTGSLVVQAVRVLGVRGNADHAARFFGQAHGVAGFARALPALYAAGWCALDGWEGAELTPQGPNTKLQGSIGVLGDAGWVARQKGMERRKTLSRAATPALIAGWRSHRVISAMVDPTKRARLFDLNFEVSEAHRRFAMLWRSLVT